MARFLLLQLHHAERDGYRGQAAMIHRDQMLLMAAGAVCPAGTTVEVNPLWALDAAEAAGKLTPGFQVSEPTYFGPL